MPMVTWSDACFSAIRKPLPLLLDDLYSSSGILVRCSRASLSRQFALKTFLQLAFFCVCAVAHGTAFVRWRRKSEGEIQNGWALYGWFTALSLCGSVVGVLAYFCRMRQLDVYYVYSNLVTTVDPTPAQQSQMQTKRAENLRWTAAHYAVYPFELAVVIAAKLLVLHRMQHLAVSRSLHPQRWRHARRGFLCVIVLLLALGICGNFGAAFYQNQGADFNVDSAGAYAINDTVTGKALRAVANQKDQIAGGLASIQRFSEVTVLIIVIAAFFTVGCFSARVIASALRSLHIAEQKLVSIAGVAGEQSRQLFASAGVQGRRLQRKVIGTFVFIFVTILVRSAFTVLYAAAQALQNNGDPCATSFCDPCHNVYSNIIGWIVYTPVFQQVTMLIASPIALLVALWGMSGVQELETMSSRQIEFMRRNSGKNASEQ